ncbi:hypothetical protein A8F94_14805 [Bacillus sp. FJAT-27225]|uniref:hypothetical protein n=1 Tax=Bacillus sp. FJAT-27225 TaxID=1743144 RepID=UPI00080C2D11|nr:hypothetical protein [Bacillus sp. FJAT-27225]OCA84004.1 hypothetical protein A8F94_14805 [Bacillus sp. FJAT-27225]
MQKLKEKLYSAIMATIVSTLATYIMFNQYTNHQIIWIVFLVYCLVVFTYGIGLSLLANFITNRFEKRIVASLLRLLIYLIFGGGYYLFEFIGIYGLIAAISFFVCEEFIRALTRLKKSISSSTNGAG